jgi:hypothetical protein
MQKSTTFTTILCVKKCHFSFFYRFEKNAFNFLKFVYSKMKFRSQQLKNKNPFNFFSLA